MRRLTMLLTANLALSLLVLGWLTWIVADPRYWFENAYEEPLPRAGPPGPVGPRGPRGVRGPIGSAGAPGIDGIDGIDGEEYDDSELRGEIERLDFDLQDTTDRLDTLCGYRIVVYSFGRQQYLNGC